MPKIYYNVQEKRIKNVLTIIDNGTKIEIKENNKDKSVFIRRENIPEVIKTLEKILQN